MSTELRFPMNPHRIDPYRNYLFRLKMEIDGEWQIVLGVSKISSLKRTSEVIKHRSGGENDREHKIPGRTFYDSILVERGLTTDTTFEEWAIKIHPFSDGDRNLVNYKRNLQLEVLNEKHKPVLRYHLHNCWVSEYSISEFDSSSNSIAIEQIRIEMEGWEKDYDLKEEFEGK